MKRGRKGSQPNIMLQCFQGLEEGASRGPSKEKGGRREKEQGGGRKEDGGTSVTHSRKNMLPIVSVFICSWTRHPAHGARRVATLFVVIQRNSAIPFAETADGLQRVRHYPHHC